MFGLTFEKLMIVLVIAVFLVGPERLPRYAAQVGRFARSLRELTNGAKERLRDEMGPEFDELDWKKLDPRQYDPRRIIREALADDNGNEVGRSAASSGSASGSASGSGSGSASGLGSAKVGEVAPFDADAT